MNPIYSRFNKKKNCKTRIEVFYSYVLVICLLGAYNAIAQSNQKFIQGIDTLIVYKDVPGLEPSEFYTIRVRSVATNNKWVNCFANITRNLASTFPNDNLNTDSNWQYFKHTDKWSQTYCNIEMSPNSSVEVEISSKNGFKIDGKKFVKATTHPSHKASIAKVVKGKVYFTIDNPASITVDINGQMDDFNALNNPIGAPVHTVTFFANPILDKPLLDDPKVVFVEPGVKPSSDLGEYTTLYFKPGVHDIGLNFKLYPGKKYYIPGDAIVYGTMNNFGISSTNGMVSGQDIKIYGLGTLSGDRLNHPHFAYDHNPSTVEEKPYKSISIENAYHVEVEGLFIANPAFHSIHLMSWNERPDKSQKVTYARWVKVVTWRVNGDGIGNAHLVEDCFIRTSDDCTYVKGDRRRCTFWKDTNAAVFHMPSIPTDFPIVIEDCDVLYLRSSENGSIGDGVFVQRTQGAKGQQKVNLFVQNIRIHDKLPNVPVFNLVSEFADLPKNHRLGGVGSSYSGITFKNITAVATFELYGAGKTEQILGAAEAPWNGGINFDNVIIAGKKLTNLDRFYTNQYVSNITFK
jgi:hypothetical protein